MIPEALESILRPLERVAVALSGGVDSAVLAAAAARILGPERVLALTATGPIFPPGEAELARETARILKVEHKEVFFDALSIPEFWENPPDRCYHCKKTLFELFLREVRNFGAKALLDGTQADDLLEDRPGLRALSELGVRSPLAEAGLTKGEVRELARGLGLLQAERPSSPCLATRFPPGEPVTREGLERVLRAEDFLLKHLNLAPIRVRLVRGEARIEAPPEALDQLFAAREKIIPVLKRLGFKRVALDLEGYRTGSLVIREKLR